MEDIYENARALLTTDEMSALWTYHHEAELKAADKGEGGGLFPTSVA